MNSHSAECLLCIAAAHENKDFLKELVCAQEAKSTLDACRDYRWLVNLFARHVCILNRNQKVEWIADLLSASKNIDAGLAIKLIIFAYTRQGLGYLTLFGLSTIINHFGATGVADYMDRFSGDLQNWFLAQLAEHNEEIKKIMEKKKAPAEVPPSAVQEPEKVVAVAVEEKAPAPEKVVNSMDYFGVSDLKTSVSHLTKSTDLSVSKIMSLEEQKNDIIKNLPFYLETVAKASHTNYANLYVTLVRIHKILLLNDPIYTQAVMVAAKDILEEMKKPEWTLGLEAVNFLALSVQAIACDANK